MDLAANLDNLSLDALLDSMKSYGRSGLLLTDRVKQHVDSLRHRRMNSKQQIDNAILSLREIWSSFTIPKNHVLLRVSVMHFLVRFKEELADFKDFTKQIRATNNWTMQDINAVTPEYQHGFKTLHDLINEATDTEEWKKGFKVGDAVEVEKSFSFGDKRYFYYVYAKYGGRQMGDLCMVRYVNQKDNDGKPRMEDVSFSSVKKKKQPKRIALRTNTEVEVNHYWEWRPALCINEEVDGFWMVELSYAKYEGETRVICVDTGDMRKLSRKPETETENNPTPPPQDNPQPQLLLGGVLLLGGASTGIETENNLPSPQDNPQPQLEDINPLSQHPVPLLGGASMGTENEDITLPDFNHPDVGNLYGDLFPQPQQTENNPSLQDNPQSQSQHGFLLPGGASTGSETDDITLPSNSFDDLNFDAPDLRNLFG